MRAALTLLSALLVLAALGVAALALGAFASVSGGGGPLFAALAAAEALLSARLLPGLGLAAWSGLAGAFGRGLGWALLASALVWLAAYLVILARQPLRPAPMSGTPAPGIPVSVPSAPARPQARRPR